MQAASGAVFVSEPIDRRPGVAVIAGPAVKSGDRAGVGGDTDLDAFLARQLDAGYRLATVILRDGSAAEDAVQEAMLNAWRRRSTLRNPEVIDAWYRRILINACRDRLRARAPQPVVDLSIVDVVMPGDHAERAAERDRLSRALGQLAADDQVLLALRYFEDLTVPQVAASLGVAEGTVKSRLHRALGKLRELLGDGPDPIEGGSR